MVVEVLFRHDLWATTDLREDDNIIDVHCLVPNGLYINFKVSSLLTLSELKEVNKIMRLMISMKSAINDDESCDDVVKIN